MTSVLINPASGQDISLTDKSDGKYIDPFEPLFVPVSSDFSIDFAVLVVH